MNKEYKSYVRFLKTAKIEIRRLTNPSIRKKKRLAVLDVYVMKIYFS